MSAPRQPLLPSELHPLSVMRILWKRKGLICALGAVGTAIVGGVVSRMPTIYMSEAVVLVDSQKIPERYVASTVSTDLQDRIATISQEILSTSQLKKIIDDFDLYREDRKRLVQEEVLERMRKDISINLERGWTGNKPGAFRLGYQAPDAAIAAQVANRLAGLYIEANLRVRENQAEGTAEFMTTQVQDAKKRLDELEAAIAGYKQKHAGELPEQQTSISSDLARAEMALQSNREGIRRAEEARDSLQNTLTVAEATVVTLSQTPRVSTPGLLAQAPPQSGPPVRTPVQTLQGQLDQLRARYGEEHPDVRRARAELAHLQSFEARPAPPHSPELQPANNAAGEKGATEKALAPLSGDRMFTIGQAQERVVSLKSNIAAIDREMQIRQADEQKILQNINLFQGRLNRLPIREQDLAKITRDYEISKTNYKALRDKSLAAEMATDMEHRQKSERFTVLDPARVPEKPTKPNRPLLGGAGAALAFGLGILAGFAAEAQKGVLLGEWELPKTVLVLGRVPVIDMDVPARPASTLRRLVIISSGIMSLLAVLGGLAYVLRGRF